MRIACVDACSVLNLLNGDALGMVASLPELRLALQGLVEDEIGESFKLVQSFVTSGKFEIISGNDILASEVNFIVNKYNLGLGESECIALGLRHNYAVVSDDRKARQAAISELGSGRVTGSVGLLKQAVAANLISAETAFERYKVMRSKGAFFPTFVKDDFAA